MHLEEAFILSVATCIASELYIFSVQAFPESNPQPRCCKRHALQQFLSSRDSLYNSHSLKMEDSEHQDCVSVYVGVYKCGALCV